MRFMTAIYTASRNAALRVLNCRDAAGESYEYAGMNEVGNSEDMGCAVYDGYIYSFSERGAEGAKLP